MHGELQQVSLRRRHVQAEAPLQPHNVNELTSQLWGTWARFIGCRARVASDTAPGRHHRPSAIGCSNWCRA
eukprot:5872163-Prymnesium_polylepis.1